MSCRDFQERLALLVGRDLEDDHATETRRHTAECPDCRESLRKLSDSHTALRLASEAPTVVEHASLWPQVRSRLMPATVARRRQDYPNWLPTATLAAACLALLIFAGSTPMMNQYDEPLSYVDPSFQIQVDRPSQSPMIDGRQFGFGGGVPVVNDPLRFRRAPQKPLQRWRTENPPIHQL